MDSEQLRISVFKAIHHTLNNGYDLTEMSAKEIVDDMIRYDEQFEETDPDDLLPHVLDWLQEAPA